MPGQDRANYRTTIMVNGHQHQAFRGNHSPALVVVVMVGGCPLVRGFNWTGLAKASNGAVR
ncbi:hypothetical protein ZHAS_00005869 [Anopheles sinensis]|uniref:Uncharacterized protein n=1 Tax=Anopheles sinensis TaxID=74873 RepID=A0A084VKH3_ANOSI|nr:hypothetical protein ZHAS_00005869 [Anopheles sinensis]